MKGNVFTGLGIKMCPSLGTVIFPNTHRHFRNVSFLALLTLCLLLDLYLLSLWNSLCNTGKEGRRPVRLLDTQGTGMTDSVLLRSSSFVFTNPSSTYQPYSKIDSNIKGFDFNCLYFPAELQHASFLQWGKWAGNDGSLDNISGRGREVWKSIHMQDNKTTIT